jgi:glycerol uptake facilitator-like aquaporin
VVPYLVAQCAGAIVASAAHLATFGAEATSAAQFGATIPTGTSQFGAFVFEFVLTFILMLVVMAVATDRRAVTAMSGLAIGAAVCVDCLAAGKCCGASMNPARSLAPAIFAGGPAIATLWLFLLAPTLGAVVAAFMYQRIRGTELQSSHRQSSPGNPLPGRI